MADENEEYYRAFDLISQICTKQNDGHDAGLIEARLHNAQQGACRLPVEVMHIIITHVAGPKYDARFVGASIPQLVSLCSHWRAVCIAYSDLWCTIHIQSQASDSCWQGNLDVPYWWFAGPVTRCDVIRVMTHVSRSRSALLSFIVHLVDPTNHEIWHANGFVNIVRFMYTFSSRFRSLEMDLNDDDDIYEGILPLPRALPNLHSFRLQAITGKSSDLITPFVPDAISAPSCLHMQGNGVALLKFDGSQVAHHTLDLSRLTYLALSVRLLRLDYMHLHGILPLIPHLRVLEIRLTFHCDYQEIFPPSFEIKGVIPSSLETLRVHGHWSWLHKIIDLPGTRTLQHLAIIECNEYIPDGEQTAHQPCSLTPLLRPITSLQSLQFPRDFADRRAARPNMCLVNKPNLAAIAIPLVWLMPSNGDTQAELVRVNLPALRYIAIYNNLNDFGEDITPNDERDFRTMINGLLKIHPDAEILLLDFRLAWFKAMHIDLHATWGNKVRRVPLGVPWRDKENNLAQLVHAYDIGDTSWIDNHWMNR